MSAISKTQQTIDGITFDLNRIKRGTLEDLAGSGDEIKLTHTLIDEVLISWPFPQEPNSAGFRELGLLDSRLVEQAIMSQLNGITEKK